ncbi:MAG: AMP-binding protein [bacterium]|nr:AMP-binding protein [bacterium]
MNKRIVHLYNRMPSGVQDVFASARGLQLRRWRYGPETDALVEAALERDSWSPAQWKPYQEARLAYILERAAKHVPYYRDHWAARRRGGDQAAVDVLANWPILEKAPLRANPQAFIAADCDPRTLYHIHTSGTTGTPVNVWWSRGMVREHYALHEARARRWYGVDRHTPFAMLGGQLVVPVEKRTPPFWVRNHVMHQLYMSSYHLNRDHAPAYIAAIRAHGAQYILAYTSSLYTLAGYLLHMGIEPPPLKAIITNAEPVYDHQRDTIERAFRCPVYETYGQAESVAFGSESPARYLHQWPEVGWIEIVEGDHPVPMGETGEIVTTGLLNEAMPLIRYRLGDRASLRPADPASGRLLPLWGRIEGRNDDVLVTRDGRRIGRLDPIFKADLPIKEAQIVQKALDHVLIRYVPDAGFAPEHERYIAAQLHMRMGELRVSFEACAALPRTQNGKLRAVISELSPEARQQIEQQP